MTTVGAEIGSACLLGTFVSGLLHAERKTSIGESASQIAAGARLDLAVELVSIVLLIITSKQLAAPVVPAMDRDTIAMSCDKQRTYSTAKLPISVNEESIPCPS